jgi:hypothetical protein
MTRRKRPLLATRYSGPRAGNRDLASLEGRCRVGEGDAAPIAVLDLDALGCRVRGITAAVRKSEPLQVWLGDIGPLAARLRWMKRGNAGVAFEAPLSEADLARAAETAVPAPAAQVIPLRRSRPGSADAA